MADVTDEPLEPEQQAEQTQQQTQSGEQTTQQGPGVSPPGPRRLYRSRDDRVVSGVCGGLGEYFGIDSVLVRIAFVLLIFAGGLGLLAYVLGWIFIAEEPDELHGETQSTFDLAVDATGVERRGGAVVLGLVFVGLGILFLLDVAWPDFLSWRYAWPIALIAVGAAIVLRARR